MLGLKGVLKETFHSAVRFGPSLVQDAKLVSFKVRLYGSWFNGAASAGQQSTSAASNSLRGLKDVVTSQGATFPSVVLNRSFASGSLIGKPVVTGSQSTFANRGRSLQASIAQNFFQQQASQIKSKALIRSTFEKAFAQEGSRRFFSGVSKILKKPAGDASSGAASKTNESSYPGKRFVEWYIQKIEEKPLLVKSLTAGAIFVASDLCAQAIGGFEGGYDLPRSLRMAGFGLFLSGPLLHFWFGLMTRTFPGRDLLSVCKKIFIGQTTVGPLFTAVFYSLNAALQGEDADAIWQRLKRDLIPTLKAGLAFWPLIDLFTYSRVPVHLMPLTNNIASFLWTIYITYIAGQK